LLLGVYKYYSKPVNPQWREAAHYIEINARSGDLLLFSSYNGMPFNCYFKRADLIRPQSLDKDRKDFKNLNELWPMIMERQDRVWVVSSESEGYNERIKNQFAEFYNISGHKEYFGIHIYLCVKKQSL
jgi:hypothetical protein